MIQTFRLITQILAAIAFMLFALTASAMTNPAATHCVESGGEYVIHKSASGETGFCRLADGTEVDAWRKFREDNAPAAKKVGLANPAAMFCVESGGRYDTATGNCSLPGGRVVNGWDYFRAHHVGNR